MNPEEQWRRMSDQEVRAAARQLDTYTEEGRRAILAEAERRGLTVGRSPNRLDTQIQHKVDVLFSPEDREAATRLLLDLQEGFTELDEGAFGLERVQAAALKVSHGEINGLRKALELGQMDFRDLLSAAGFGGSHAHDWWLQSEVAEAAGSEKVSLWQRLRQSFFGNS